MEGSWFFAKKKTTKKQQQQTNKKTAVCSINETEPSDWLNLKWFESIAKAWISLHLFAVASTDKKT